MDGEALRINKPAAQESLERQAPRSERGVQPGKWRSYCALRPAYWTVREASSPKVGRGEGGRW